MEKQLEITITTLPNNVLEVRETTIYIEDGMELTRKNHRYCVTPIDDYSDKPQKVKEFSDFLFTEEVKQAYRANLPEIK